MQNFWNWLKGFFGIAAAHAPEIEKDVAIGAQVLAAAAPGTSAGSIAQAVVMLTPAVVTLTQQVQAAHVALVASQTSTAPAGSRAAIDTHAAALTALSTATSGLAAVVQQVAPNTPAAADAAKVQAVVAINAQAIAAVSALHQASVAAVQTPAS